MQEKGDLKSAFLEMLAEKDECFMTLFLHLLINKFQVAAV